MMMAETGLTAKVRREKERDGSRRAQSGKDPHQGSDEDPDKTVEEIGRLKYDLKPIKKPVKYFHAQKPKGPAGSWVFSQSLKRA